MSMRPEPTKRAVIDPLRRCNVRCVFCYYMQAGDFSSVHSWDSVKAEIDAAKARGNESIEITGGEPTMHPQICELIEYALKLGMPARMITNGIVSETRLREILGAGLKDVLISLHGLEATHNEVVQLPNARKIQEKTMGILRDAGMRFCTNTVIMRKNQGEIEALGAYIAQWKPRISNFLGFNPHHGWRNDPRSADMVADLRVVAPLLERAIDTLEAVDTGVNCRYFPMCHLPERLRRCVANDRHVAFDPAEWDYAFPKTFEAFDKWGREASAAVEEKGEPCCRCDLQNVCGGANKYWHAAATAAFGAELLIPQTCPDVTDKQDFYWYRQHNEKGMRLW